VKLEPENSMSWENQMNLVKLPVSKKYDCATLEEQDSMKDLTENEHNKSNVEDEEEPIVPD